jgi:hypothetical protein
VFSARVSGLSREVDRQTARGCDLIGITTGQFLDWLRPSDVTSLHRLLDRGESTLRSRQIAGIEGFPQRGKSIVTVIRTALRCAGLKSLEGFLRTGKIAGLQRVAERLHFLGGLRVALMMHVVGVGNAARRSACH